MSPRTKSKPIVDENTMGPLEGYFYKSFQAKLIEKSIDIGGLKKLADRCSTDSPLREVLLELPERISRIDMVGLVYPLYSGQAGGQDRKGRISVRTYSVELPVVQPNTPVLATGTHCPGWSATEILKQTYTFGSFP